MAKEWQKAKVPPEIREDWEIITRGVEEIVPVEDMLSKLVRSKKTEKPLKIKAGFDPTAPHVHLGWSVPLRKMRQFQDLGHEVVFLFGDFTAMIGDPSGKSETRRQLTREEVLANSKSYEEQIFKILDPNKTRIEFNSRWLDGMSLINVVKLAANYTVARMLEREDFRTRYTEQRPISIHEFLYPLFQAYDSVALEADIEMGGNDQMFNFMVARDIMKAYGQEPQAALTMPLLVGLDGVQKMSQSLGNYVGLTEAPEMMFGKLMSIPDSLIATYMELLTAISISEIRETQAKMDSEGFNPMEAKKRLAGEIVRMYHGAAAAKEAEEHFARTVQQGEVPEDIPEHSVSEEKIWLPRILKDAGLVKSTSEAKNLLAQRAVSIDGATVSEEEITLKSGESVVIKAGKRRFLRVCRG